MSKKNEVSVNGRLEKERVIRHLEAIVSGLKDGTVYVQQGMEYVGLTPGQFVEFELEAIQKKSRETLEIKLEWKRQESLSEDEDVNITTRVPEIPVPAPESNEGSSTSVAD